MKLGLLEPDGTFTAQAGMDYSRRNEICPEVKWYKRIEDCFEVVGSEEVDKAVVPILNSTSTAAWVLETLDRLKSDDVRIYDEQILPIRLHLATSQGVKLEDVKCIYSKDKAFPQCKSEILSLDVEFINENSTAAAAKYVSKSSDRAAIVPLRAVELYELDVLKGNIQKDPDNKTKFIVISKEDHKPTGSDKTTVIYEFRDIAKPCLLYGVLKELAERDISLGYVQSIPKGRIDEFTFYMEIIGHRRDKCLEDAIKAIENNPDLSFWKVLGSYPF